jgi:hypothetical protein
LACGHDSDLALTSLEAMSVDAYECGWLQVLCYTYAMFFQSPFPPPPLSAHLPPPNPVENFIALATLFGFFVEAVLYLLPQPWSSEALNFIFEAATFGRYRK